MEWREKVGMISHSSTSMFNVGSSMFDVRGGLPTSSLRVGHSEEEGVGWRPLGSPGWLIGICGLKREFEQPCSISNWLKCQLFGTDPEARNRWVLH